MIVMLRITKVSVKLKCETIMTDRYSRQILFSEIGEAGQKKLKNSFIVIIGCGALGTIMATSLVRAGVGKVRIIDRDFIEYHKVIEKIIAHLKLTFMAERPLLPQIVQQELLMAAEEREEYF